MVDPYDDAFNEPVKVIGRLLSKEEAEQEEKHGNYVTEVEGGYRRIVAAQSHRELSRLILSKRFLTRDRWLSPAAVAEFQC